MSCLNSKKCNQLCPMRTGKACWLRQWNRYQRWILVAVVLILTAVLSFNAMAATWVTPNQDGGEIVMTDKSCPDNKGKWSAYYYGKDGESTLGCYDVEDDVVHVLWETGKTRVYPISIFKERRPFTRERS